MQESFSYIYLSASVICLLLALGFLISPRLQLLPSRLLGINYGLYAVQNFLGVLILGFGWEFATLLRASIAMTLGPAIYFFTPAWLARCIRRGYAPCIFYRRY